MRTKSQNIKAEQANPCLKEQNQSYECLNRNNFDHEKCEKYFENYNMCKKFWVRMCKLEGKVYSDRRAKGIQPYLPSVEDREQIKKEYLAQVRFTS